MVGARAAAERNLCTCLAKLDHPNSTKRSKPIKPAASRTTEAAAPTAAEATLLRSAFFNKIDQTRTSTATGAVVWGANAALARMPIASKMSAPTSRPRCTEFCDGALREVENRKTPIKPTGVEKLPSAGRFVLDEEPHELRALNKEAAVRRNLGETRRRFAMASIVRSTLRCVFVLRKAITQKSCEVVSLSLKKAANFHSLRRAAHTTLVELSARYNAARVKGILTPHGTALARALSWVLIRDPN